MVFLDSTCRYTKYIKTRLLRFFRVPSVCRYIKIHKTHGCFSCTICRYTKIHETRLLGGVFLFCFLRNTQNIKIHETHGFFLDQPAGTPKYTERVNLDSFLFKLQVYTKLHETFRFFMFYVQVQPNIREKNREILCN